MVIYGHSCSQKCTYICVTLKIACPFFQDRRCDFPKRDMPFLKNAHAILNQLLIPPFSRSKKVSFLAWQGTLSQLSSLNLRLSIRHISTISISFSNRLLFCHLAGFQKWIIVQTRYRKCLKFFCKTSSHKIRKQKLPTPKNIIT